MAAVKRHVLFRGLPPECAALRNYCRIRQLVRDGTNRNVEYRPAFLALSASGSGTSRGRPIPSRRHQRRPWLSVTDADGDGTPGAKGQRTLALPKELFIYQKVIDK